MIRLPKTLRFSLRIASALLALLSLARLAFLWQFGGTHTLQQPDVLRALQYGFRFDLRVTLIVIAPFLLFGGWRLFSPFLSTVWRRIWTGYFTLAFTLCLAAALVDFGHYSYLRSRLNAAILNFLGDWQTSGEMVWQTYPVLRFLIPAVLGIYLIAKWISGRFECLAQIRVHQNPSRLQRIVLNTVVFFGIVLGMHGQISQYPLRWSDAFFSADPFVSSLGLNPLVNFFDTLDYQRAGYDVDQVKTAYPIIANWLKVPHPDLNTLSLRREIAPRVGALSGQPNIVLVLVESFSAYKTSLFGNPLKTTPYFDQMAQNGVQFTRYFTPHFGTAHGVFATLTGIPDVETANTSSRNPQAADQHILIDSAFPDYQRFYFIGGSTSWANIRGLLSNNIRNIDIREEGNYQSPRNDTWGISDTNLFKEANNVFKTQDKPFFAIIQTSGNHRPYTIPAEDKDFEVRKVDDATLKANGFDSLDEFNSFRYMDYSIRTLIETAKKEKYFDNTIFVFTGDHGITGNAGKLLPDAWTSLRLSSVHTPFLLYAPKLLKPAVHSRIASQIDVLPTLAGLLNRPYVNTAFGRDLLDPTQSDAPRAFVITHDRGPEIGLVEQAHYFMMRADGHQRHLADLNGDDASVDQSAQAPEAATALEKQTRAFYEMARYQLLNNHKAKVHP